MNILICNTKGGVGKSFLSTQILPLAFDNTTNNINIFELDNNNKTNLNSKVLNFKNLNVNKIDEILFDIALDIVEVINIIDAGGGDDTKNVINALSENDVKIDTFIVPITRDFEVIKNLEDTINLIKQNFNKPKIFVILNKVESSESIEEQFLYLFGSEEYQVDNIIDKFNNITFIPITNYKEIDIVKNIYKTTSLNIILKSENIVNNLSDFQKKWLKEAKENFDDAQQQRAYFAKKMAFYRLIKKMLNIEIAIKKSFNF